MDDAQRETILTAVLNAGINYIDTAGCYGNSEELIGRYLSHRSSEFYLATKCGCSPNNGNRWTRESVMGDLHRSLKRLKTDYVDVMQPHNPTVEQSETNELVGALVEMRDQGKVRWIGISTTLPHLPTYLEWGVFDIFQIPYSALERDHEGWITKAAEAGIGIAIRGGVAMGEPGVGKGTTARWAKFEEARLDDLREEGESRTSFILRHTLTHPHADTNIVGTTNPDHLRENVEAVLKGPLSAEVYSEAQRRLNEVGVVPEAINGPLQ
jgi:aryl-alcohol dehydrogenase-like predicted oxidoreductase